MRRSLRPYPSFWRGVEIPDAAATPGLDRRRRLVVAERRHEVAKRRPAKTDFGHLDRGPPDAAPLARLHPITPTLANRSA
jgi:hypothetical protein